MTTNSQSCTSNQKSDVSCFLPVPSNYKEYPDFEKHILYSAKSGAGRVEVGIAGQGRGKLSSIKPGILIKGVGVWQKC